MKKNSMQRVNFTNMKNNVESLTTEIQINQEKFEEVLESGVSKDTLLNMIEYDYEVFRNKEIEYAKAASLTKEECNKKRKEIEQVPTVIKSDKEAYEKVLALKLM